MTVNRYLACVLVAALAGLLAVTTQPALASTPSPQWTVTAVSLPTNFAPGGRPGQDAYKVTVTNTGAAATDGSAIKVTDELPAGLTLDSAGAFGEDELLSRAANSKPGGQLSCILRTCTYAGTVAPDDGLTITFPVDTVPGGPSETTNLIRVSGGGAAAAAMAIPTTISSTPAAFGISPGGATTALSTTQAGAHPDLTTSIAFNTVNPEGALAGYPKNVTDELPPGFAGDLIHTPNCSTVDFSLQRCPVDTQIGIALLVLSSGIKGEAVTTELTPVYNLSPDPGEVAKIGFFVIGNFGVQGGVVLRPDGYGLNTTFRNVNESATALDVVSLTIWGVPADPSHDSMRWNGEPRGNQNAHFGATTEAAAAPFFTNPTTCGDGPLEARFSANSWEDPEHSVGVGMPFGPVVGCDRLGMEPAVTAEVTSDKAYSATGLDVATKMPQNYENADGLVSAALKKEVVTLPEGMTINPSSGAGLQACTEAEFAEEGIQYVANRGCPPESKLATVDITTPSFTEHVKGSLFLAEPASFGEAGKNPFDALLALYLIVRTPNRGVLIKVPGEVVPNLSTGRLVTTFDNLPPLPFSLATFSFNQGANAPLVTPPTCGSYTVQAQLAPYSEPAGAPLEPLVPPFSISSGVGGGPCPAGGAPPFHPQAIAGSQNAAAGSYSPFYLRIVREDGEQELTRFSTVMPPGLTGKLTGIPFCPDSAIEAARGRTGITELNEPSCPAASKIGHTVVGAGVGPVLAQTPGSLYLAGPYHGAPFSLVSVTSATVGPFDLGTVVIRFALRINPITTQVEVDATGSDPIPHIIKGIVTHVRDIRAYVDRPDFIIDPTSCEPMQIANTITGAGADPSNPADQTAVTVPSPFQVADCASLAFKPQFNVSTSAHTSRADGASLHVKVSYPPGSIGKQANLHAVKVDLPKQLPSRLTTLQRACPHAIFEADPAGCPGESIVGHAVVHTQLIPVPLEGPAYFVSYGGEEFPKLIMVLQGYGVTVELVGNTFIKKGVTSSTFRSTPDTPFESFELTLPQGKFSALAANGDLCAAGKTVTVAKHVKRRVHGRLKTVTVKVKKKGPGLVMPTALTAQNGAVIHQSTAVQVTGCSKATARNSRRRAPARPRKGRGR